MSPDNSSSGCFARIIWFMFGPMALLVLAIMIVEKRQGWLGMASIAFLIVLLMTVVARWIDFRGGNAMTAEGEPATERDVRQFMSRSSLIGAAIWVIANLIGGR